MKLYLLRHGETEGNRRMCYYGTTNLPLLPESVAKLQQNAARYPRADHYYISGLLRTEQTLHALYGDVPYTVVPDLEELHFGIFEMHTHDELKDMPEYQEWLRDFEHNRCPGGESPDEVQQRSVRAVKALLQKGEDAVCIVHGGVITAILMYYFGGPRFGYNMQPGTGCCIDFTDGHARSWHRIPEETK